MTTTAQTPSHIVATVVYTLAFIAIAFVLTLSICILTGRTIPETLSAHFANVGNTVLGVLAGLLINTKSNPPVTSSETVSTTTERVEPESEKPTT